MSESLILGDILPVAELSAGDGVERKMKPWHHPRKQVIRDEQWARHVAALLDDLPEEKQPLRYLGLPGEDLLDVRIMHEICQERQRMLLYLGFNLAAGDYTSESLARQAEFDVRQLECIDPQSLVVLDRLENVVEKSSKAARAVVERAPFHVINLDLCNSITTKKKSSEDYFRAIHSILQCQMQAKAPWLFFLTTRISPQEISSAYAGAFQSCIDANWSANDEFRRAFQRNFRISEERLAGNLFEKFASPERRDLFRKLFGAGFGKWFLSLLQGSSPLHSVELMSSYFYRVGNGASDIVSYAFKLVPKLHLAHDRYNLVPSKAGDHDEARMALNLLHEVENIADAEAVLNASMQSRKKYFDRTRGLLLAARYPTELVGAFLSRFPMPNQ